LNLIVLDIEDLFGGQTRLRRNASSADIVVLPARPETAAWVSRTTQIACEPAFHADLEDLQQSLGALLTDIISMSPLTFAGLDLSACLEYVGWLSLVQLVRDALVLRQTSAAVSRSKGAGIRARWITGRRETAGLLGLLSADRRFEWTVETWPEPRYAESRIGDARPRMLPLTVSALRDSVARRPRGTYSLATWSELSALRRSARGDSRPALLLPVSPAAAIAHLSPRRALEVGWSANVLALQCVRSVVPPVARWFAKTFPEFPMCRGLLSSLEDYLAAGIKSCVWPALASAAMVLGDYVRPPSAVLVGNDVTPGFRAAVLAASAKGIKSIMVQHGLFAMRLLHDRPLADRIGVWGPAGKAWIESCGVDPARIDIVGHPTLRLRAPSRTTERPPLRHRRLRVLYLSSCPYSGFHLDEDQCVSLRYLAAAYEACRTVGAQLVARPHPSERSGTWGLSVDDESVPYRVDLGPSVTHSVACADIVVTTASTTVLDALSLGKPVVLFQLEPTSLLGYDEVGIFHRASSATDLAEVLESIDPHAGPSASECAAALGYLAGPLDGHMGERLAMAAGLTT
jgi:hypothetical protein